MSTYLPAFQVALPILSAPICFFLKRVRNVWAFALLISVIATITSAILLYNVYQTGNITLYLGAFLASSGIEFNIDYLSAYSLLAICTISTLVLIGAHTILDSQLDDQRHIALYGNLLMCLAGVSGVIVSGDLISAFLFLEISSFAAYNLAVLDKGKQSALAGFRYFVAGSIGAVTLLAGIILCYSVFGTVNFSAMSANADTLNDTGRLRIALILLAGGIALKLGLFPFHLWLPSIYRNTPAMASIFLATMIVQVTVYLLLRTSGMVVTAGLLSTDGVLVMDILVVMSLGAVILGSIAAIYQHDLKLLLAYSTLAQIGFMVLGLAIGNHNGLMASSIHLFNHSLVHGLLFLGIVALIYRTGHTHINGLAGLGKHMPWTFAALVIAGLSLIGLPLTAGFVGKWYLILGLVENEAWIVLALIMLGTLLTCIYIWRIIEPAYLRSAPAGNAARGEAPLSLLVPVWMLAIGNIYLGIDTRLVAGTSQIISQSLFGISQ